MAGCTRMDGCHAHMHRSLIASVRSGIAIKGIVTSSFARFHEDLHGRLINLDLIH